MPLRRCTGISGNPGGQSSYGPGKHGHPALRARAGGGVCLLPVWVVRVAVGQVGWRRSARGNIRLHYHCRSRRAEPILAADPRPPQRAPLIAGSSRDVSY